MTDMINCVTDLKLSKEERIVLRLIKENPTIIQKVLCEIIVPYLTVIYSEKVKVYLEYLFHRNNMECCSIYSKFDLHSGKTKAIDALRIILVGRSWVLGQEGKKGLTFIFRNLFQKFIRTFNIKGIVFQRTAEAFGSLRVAVYVRKVGFDVKDWCAIH